MPSTWIDLVRDLRWGLSSQTCDCSIGLLLFCTFLSGVVCFWTGCLVTGFCLSPRCRLFISNLIRLSIVAWGQPEAAAAGAAGLARARFREYRGA